MSAPVPPQPQSFRLLVGEVYTLTAYSAPWSWPPVAVRDPFARVDGWPPLAPQPTVGQEWPVPSWASLDEDIATVEAIPDTNRAVITAMAPGTTLIVATVLDTSQNFLLDVVPATPEWVALSGSR